MDFIDEVKARSGRFAARVEHLKKKDATEEATKTSFVLPFIQMLGYDIFNPAEVIPEYTADIGTKKGEKVDYALLKDDRVVILIECKKIGHSLSRDAVSQLLRYFGVTETRVGILTDGISYLFFSDLDQANVMDPRPFFEFNMMEFADQQVRELKRFTKEAFDKSLIVGAAKELRYAAEIKTLLANELIKPSDEFVGYVVKQVYEGRNSVAVRNMFRGLAHSAFNQFINDRIQSRLTKALKQEGESEKQSTPVVLEETKPEFTKSELDGLNVIKAILGGLLDPRSLKLYSFKVHSSIVLNSGPEYDKYQATLFKLRARLPETIKLGAPEFGEIQVGSIEDFFSHAGRIRKFIKEKFKIKDVPAATEAGPEKKTEIRELSKEPNIVRLEK